MHRSIKPTFTKGARLILGVTVVATLTGWMIGAMPDARPPAADGRTSRPASEVANPWGAGNAAVSRHLAELGGTPQLPDLDDPVVRQRFACSFAPGSFGIPPELSPELGASTYCREAELAKP